MKPILQCIRVILLGDFLQLLPFVPSSTERAKKVPESSAWREMKFKCIKLTKVVSQDDPQFRSPRSEIWTGKCSTKILETLDRDVKTAYLAPRRRVSDNTNSTKMAEVRPGRVRLGGQR